MALGLHQGSPPSHAPRRRAVAVAALAAPRVGRGRRQGTTRAAAARGGRRRARRRSPRRRAAGDHARSCGPPWPRLRRGSPGRRTWCDQGGCSTLRGHITPKGRRLGDAPHAARPSQQLDTITHVGQGPVERLLRPRRQPLHAVPPAHVHLRPALPAEDGRTVAVLAVAQHLVRRD